MNLAYVAGFFDGEGCVGFTKCRTSIYPRVLITNTNLAILKEIKSIFGGDINKLSLRKQGWKQGYSLRISWSNAVRFLDKIEPYLILKLKQAQTVFAWDEIRGKKADNDAIDLLVRRMHWLNQKGEVTTQDPIEEVVAIAMSKAGKSKKKGK